MSSLLSPAEALAYAKQLHQEGQLEAASEVYRRILEVAPDTVDAVHFLGVATHQLGKSEEAIELIRRAIALDPEYADAYNNLGNVLKRQGRLNEALEMYAQAHELRPEDPDTLNNVGALLKANGQLDAALAIYRKVLDLCPDHVDTLHNLGNVYLALGRPQKALDAYRRAVLLRPYEGSSYRRLGAAFHSSGLLQEATDVYRKWLEIEPDNAEAKHLIAACTGQDVPARASDEMVAQMFNRFAASFDEVLEHLHYKAPELVAEAIGELLGPPAGSLVVLDAGCGTGLGGASLRPYAKRLVGMDLADRMLAASSERKLYDELVLAELTAHLTGRPGVYDLIASADTLVYFGDLAEVARGFACALRSGGTVVFTVEGAEPAEAPLGYRLNPHGRYSHTAAYAAEVLTRAGLAVRAVRPGTLRLEAGKPVEGLIVSASKRQDDSSLAGG